MNRNILARMKEWAGITRDPEVIRFQHKTNMRVIFVGGLMTAVVELLMIFQAQSFAHRNVSAENRSIWMREHMPAYLILFATSLIVAIYANRFLKKNYKLMSHALLIEMAFTFVGVGFGAYISYMDYISGDQIFTFFATSFCAAALLIYNPIFSILYFPISYYIYFVYLNSIQPWTPGSRINYDIICFVLVIISVFRYNVSRFDAKNQIAIERMLSYDVLTGAKNLHSLERDREKYVDQEVFFLLADIDDFKYFNDRFGHAAGDDVIKQVVWLANKNAAFPKDIYRINGDEICVLIKNSDIDSILDFAKRWMDNVRQIQKNGYEMYINMSMGITYGTPKSVEEVVEMQRFADREMFSARKQGGNRVMTAAYSEAKKLELDGVMNNTSFEANNLDTLTGLPNLVLFRERAQKIMVNMQNNDVPYAYVFLDILNFRNYNERYGFQSGDLLLKQLAVVLQDAFTGCLITRVGEDHFILITELDHIIDRIEDVHRALHTMQQEVFLELKAGIYEPSRDDYNVSQACDRAKLVCDSIKTDFNKIYKYYDNDVMKELEKRQYIVTHIDEAIEKGYVQVYYQPLVRTISGELCGVEALARWNDPVYGFLQPVEFIEALEQNRLIYKLDRFMARQICKEHTKFRELGYPVVPVSFNISRLDFESTNVVKFIEDAVNEYRVPHDMVHVEITESAFVENIDYMKQEVDRLQKKGYQVWMDDFGSGYSSLNIMQDYPFDLVKLDMVFLKNYSINPRAKEILASMVDMCKRLGIQTLAEGVETKEQYEFLKSIGCEKVQGFLFDKPQPFEKITKAMDRKELVIENRARRDYYDTIGRVNVLSQAPMDYFEEVMEKAATDSEQIFFSGFPLAIAECVDNQEFRYLLSNDKYNELLELINRGGLEESAQLINALSGKFKDSFREGLQRSKRNGTMEVVEYEIDGRHYVTHMRYITSMKNRDAILLALENTSYDNLTIV